jgi:hypothetical protein
MSETDKVYHIERYRETNPTVSPAAAASDRFTPDRLETSYDCCVSTPGFAMTLASNGVVTSGPGSASLSLDYSPDASHFESSPW